MVDTSLEMRGVAAVKEPALIKSVGAEFRLEELLENWQNKHQMTSDRMQGRSA